MKYENLMLKVDEAYAECTVSSFRLIWEGSKINV